MPLAFDDHISKNESHVPPDECGMSGIAPGWWFHYFEPLWGPTLQMFCRYRNVTLSEFELAASQVPSLIGLEKTIAISSFLHHRRHAVTPSVGTTALRRV